MTDRQIRYAMSVAGRVSHKHTPPDPYNRSDLFQEIMTRIMSYAKRHPHLTEVGWIGYKINWLVIDIVNRWKGIPQVEYNPHADTRAILDEYPMYAEEILSYLDPKQAQYVVARAAGYGPQEIPATGARLKSAVARLTEAGYSEV
jgi:hypothetical protein